MTCRVERPQHTLLLNVELTVYLEFHKIAWIICVDDGVGLICIPSQLRIIEGRVPKVLQSLFHPPHIQRIIGLADADTSINELRGAAGE